MGERNKACVRDSKRTESLDCKDGVRKVQKEAEEVAKVGCSLCRAAQASHCPCDQAGQSGPEDAQ